MRQAAAGGHRLHVKTTYAACALSSQREILAGRVEFGQEKPYPNTRCLAAVANNERKECIYNKKKQGPVLV